MPFVKGLTGILVAFLVAMSIQAPTMAATINVSDATGLRSALLTAATNGGDDVILLTAGTYSTGGTTFTFVTNENKTLTLQGTNGTTRDQVILDGGGTSQVLNFSCVGSCGAVTLQGLTVQNGKATENVAGGGINASTTLTVSDVSFSANAASSRNGGAIFARGAVTVSNATFSNNTAGSDGGAMYVNGPVTVTNSTFSNNTSTTGRGGAIFIFDGTATVTNATFSNNTAGMSGGAMYGGGEVTVSASSFTNNTAATNGSFGFGWGYPSPGGGGAISGFGAVINSAFSNNTAGGGGGAIAGSGIVINSLFNNNATTSILFVEPFSSSTRVEIGCGGAIRGFGIIVNNTFSGNSTIGLGDAIGVGAAICGAKSIINSVFYGHSTPAIYAKSAYNLYYNLIDTNTGIAGSIPIMVGNVAPGATSPFADAANGNFRLAVGSPAIDAGLDPNSTTFANLIDRNSLADIRQALLTDLQGYLRPAARTSLDIGAYEYGSGPRPAASPAYRFFNTNAGGHFYTIDEAEKNTVIQNYNWFRYEGVGFYAYPDALPGMLPVYRFFNMNAGGHFYTISEAEKNIVIQNYNWFRYEGIGFYAFPVAQPGTLPLYRFFNHHAGGHFYTINEAEKNTVFQNYNWFQYEGFGFHAYPSP